MLAGLPRRAAAVAFAALALALALAAIVSPAPASAAKPMVERKPVATSGRVAVYLTTADLRHTLARQPDVMFHPGTAAGSDVISVDPARTFQRLEAGFGLAMTDTSAYELDRQLPARQRDEVMRRLFSRVGGIGLSFLRVPIGGSDYVVGSPYTYDDVPSGQTDPTLARFSIAHDRAYILPMIRQALGLNPAMSVMANPWTPPAWMKTDDTLITRTGPLGYLEPQYYSAYARYLVKFLQAYRAAGVPVDYLGVQNEPLTPLLLVAGIPESYLAPQDEGTLIHGYVAPALRLAGLTPKILAFDDHFESDLAYLPPVMASAAGDVAGFAYHCYLSDPSSMGTIHSLYPRQLLLETECSTKLSNVYPEQMAIRVLRNGAQGVQLWNVALDEHYGPKIGNGCQGITPPFQGQQCIAPVTVNTATHTYSLTSDYWALAQFSKFIQLGAQRIESSDPSSCPTSPATGWTCGLEDIAFRNPDGSQVIVATAHDGKPHTAVIAENGQSFTYAIPDGSTATFVLPAPRPTITHLRAPRKIRPHTTLRATFTLEENATVRAALQRILPHHRRGSLVVKTFSGTEGSNTVSFSGRRTRARLAPGRYRLTLTATDAGGDSDAGTELVTAAPRRRA